MVTSYARYSDMWPRLAGRVYTQGGRDLLRESLVGSPGCSGDSRELERRPVLPRERRCPVVVVVVPVVVGVRGGGGGRGVGVGCGVGPRRRRVRRRTIELVSPLDLVEGPVCKRRVVV